MNQTVCVYIYKRFDPDLIGLIDSGYSLSKMMRDSLLHYAHGEAFNIYIPDLIRNNLGDKKSVRFLIRLSDPESIRLINQAKRGMKSHAMKTILRAALIQQNACCLFTGEDIVEKQKIAFNHLPVNQYTNLVSADEYKNSDTSFEFEGKAIKVQRPVAESGATVRADNSKLTKQAKTPKPKKEAEKASITAVEHNNIDETVASVATHQVETIKTHQVVPQTYDVPTSYTSFAMEFQPEEPKTETQDNIPVIDGFDMDDLLDAFDKL